MSVQVIEVGEILKAKKPKLYKRLPKFVIRLLERIIHQDEVNRVLREYGHLYGLEFVSAVLEDFKVSYEVEGLDRLDQGGRYIFASNHPLGGFDGLILMDAIGKLFPKIKFVVNDLLMHLQNLKPLFVPVNKHGRQSADYALQIEGCYAGEGQVLYFPAGLCSRRQGKEIKDLEWHKSFVQKAVQYSRDVVPIYFEGYNSNRFYNVAYWRKKLGIKGNFEMLLLPDELFKQKGKHYRLKFGDVMGYKSFEGGNARELAGEVRRRVYEMRGR